MSGTVPTSPRMELAGQELGCYRVLRLIGRGGMGAVYEATHVVLGRRAAIKVLHSHLVRDREAQQRLLMEARAESTLLHPGVVSVFDVGATPGGSVYIAMEFLMGQTLADQILKIHREQVHAGPVLAHLQYAVRLARELAGTFRFIHQSGIIHRDLKPENIFLVPDPEAAHGERVKVLDFGIAKLREGDPRPLRAPIPGLTHYEPTQIGVVLGTPAYRAPELWRGESAEARVDVYALGCVLYELIEGTLPFPAADMTELRLQHMYGPIPVLQRYRTIAPPELSELMRQMLAKNVSARPSMGDVVDVLRKVEGRLCESPPGPRFPSSLMKLGSAQVLSLVAAPASFLRHRRSVLALAAVLVLIVVRALIR